MYYYCFDVEEEEVLEKQLRQCLKPKQGYYDCFHDWKDQYHFDDLTDYYSYLSRPVKE